MVLFMFWRLRLMIVIVFLGVCCVVMGVLMVIWMRLLMCICGNVC